MNKQISFDSVPHSIAMYRTSREPSRVAIVVESSVQPDRSITLCMRQYIITHTWSFCGPKKVVYSILMNRLYNTGIRPVSGEIIGVNPSNKMICDIDSQRADDIMLIIDAVSKGLTYDPTDQRPKVIHEEHSAEHIDSAEDVSGISLSRDPAVLIVRPGRSKSSIHHLRPIVSMNS